MQRAEHVEPRKAGWLEKQGHMVRSWKRRFIMIGAGDLLYYNVEVLSMSVGESGGLRGQIFLGGASVEVCEASKRPYCLYIKCGENDLMLDCGDEETQASWQTAIEAEIEETNERIVSSGELAQYPTAQIWWNDLERHCTSLFEQYSTETTFVKHYTRLGFKVSHPRLLSIRGEDGSLVWREESASSPTSSQVIDLASVHSIQQGRHSTALEALPDDVDACCMVVDGARKLGAQFEDEATCAQWITDLRTMARFTRIERSRQQASHRRANQRARSRQTDLRKQLSAAGMMKDGGSGGSGR